MQEQLITVREFKLLSLTILLAICGSLGVDIHLASLPHIMAYMHTTRAHMQQSVTFFILGVGLSMLVYGPLSDKVGRKPVVIFGLCLACVTSYSAALAQAIIPFLSLRILQDWVVVFVGDWGALSRLMSCKMKGWLQSVLISPCS